MFSIPSFKGTYFVQPLSFTTEACSQCLSRLNNAIEEMVCFSKTRGECEEVLSLKFFTQKFSLTLLGGLGRKLQVLNETMSSFSQLT